MTSIRFVQGNEDEYSVVYDCDWPIVPRVGETVSFAVETDRAMDYEVTRICHRADAGEKLSGTLAWIRPSADKVPLGGGPKPASR